MTIGGPQSSQATGIPFGPLYLRKHSSPLDPLPSPPNILPHRIPHPWSPHGLPAAYFAHPLNALNGYRGGGGGGSAGGGPFMNPATAAYLQSGGPSFQNLLAQLNGAAAAAVAMQQQHHQHQSHQHLHHLSPAAAAHHDFLLKSASNLMYSSDNSRSPNQSPGSESENSSATNNLGSSTSISTKNSKIIIDVDSSGTTKEPQEEGERRSSSIQALRVKAREHELKLGLLSRNPSEPDIVIT